MKIFEYHKFAAEPDEYQYSRTLKQFEEDLDHTIRSSDIVRFDDGHAGQWEALKIAEAYGIKVVVGITTDFIGKPGYLTWDQVRVISQYHILGNHSRAHEHLNELSRDEILEEIAGANIKIYEETSVMPRFYLPTYNYVNRDIRQACQTIGLEILDPVIIMYNHTP